MTATSWDNLVDAFNAWALDQGEHILLGVCLAVACLLLALALTAFEDRHDHED